jgi:hypothetical protein
MACQLSRHGKNRGTNGLMNIKSALSAIAVAGMLVVTADYATQAATGGSFLLGRSNSANQSTRLTNTGTGPVLKLSTTHPGTRAPLGVNSSVRVANLNADKVDGKHASQLGVNTRVYRQAVHVEGVSQFDIVVPNVAAGKYLVTYGAWLYVLTSNTDGWCWVDKGSSDFVTASAQAGSNGAGHALPNGAGIVRLTTSGSIRVHCDYAAPVTADSFAGAPMEIVLTKISSQTGAVVPRVAAPRSPIG